MDKNKMVIIGVVAAVILGGIIYMNIGGRQTPTYTQDMIQQGTTPAVTEAKTMMEGSQTVTNGAMMEGKTVSVNIEARNFSFSTKEIKVKKGDTVKVQLTRKEGFHDWTLDEFNARTKQLQAGQTDTVEFVANKAGTFEYYCSVGQHRGSGMVGKLVVE